MDPFEIINNLRLQDILDVFLLTVVAYHLYCWFRGTKAFKALVGLLVLGMVYTLANFWGLFLTTWVFQILWQVLILMIIILFQSEIRQVLERVNPLQKLIRRKSAKPQEWVPGLVRAVFSMAKNKIGALIVIERLDLLAEVVAEGQKLEALPSQEILFSIFQKDSPLHDGAVLIKHGRVTQVASYLPLSTAEGLPKEWGTRHRAALGLSERCDAWVVVVSEERGHVSLARGGKMLPMGNSAQLSESIMEAVTPVFTEKKSRLEKVHSLLTRQWPAKVGSLLLVGTIWLLLAGQQDFEATFTIPLKIINVPSRLELVDPVNPKVDITVGGLRKDASTLDDANVYVEIDLSGSRSGKRTLSIRRDRVSLPSDRVYVVNIKPSEVEFHLEEKAGLSGKKGPD